MRPNFDGIVTDHDLMLGQTENDHHPVVESHDVLINSLSIPTGDYEKRITLSRSGHKTVRLIMRGPEGVGLLQGHTGGYFVGTDVSARGVGISMRPYGGGGYFNVYMGGYSRLHGDSYLSHMCFGSSIRCKDVYIDDDELVIVFTNASGSNQNLTAYGLAVVK